jgi:tetratricopeptide (TPR) repeat protein
MAKKIKPPRDKEAEKRAEEAEKVAEEAKKAAAAEKLAAAAQDEFQARGFELVEWMQEHRPVVLGFIAVVVLAGLGFGIYTVSEKNKNTVASVAFAQAQKLWEAPIGEDPDPDDDVPAYPDVVERSKAARAAFEKVAAEHKGTGAGAFASLSAGHAALKLSDLDGAIANYRAFLAATRANDPLRFAGYAGLAAALDGKGDTKGAIAALEDQVALGQTQKVHTDEDAALLTLGSLYAKEGDTEKARARLEKLIAEFPESPLKSRADEQLATLGTQKPTDKAASDKPVDDKKPDDKKPDDKEPGEQPAGDTPADAQQDAPK